MGVIDVVAVLTLPNLNQSTNKKEKVAKVKKLYQDLNDASDRAEVFYGPISSWFNNTSCNQNILYIKFLIFCQHTIKINF